MTAKELSAMLNGREYGNEISKAEEELAKENGLVVVFGCSDDLMELCGAIYDEADVYDGGTVMLEKDGIVTRENECRHCKYFKAAKTTEIKALWYKNGVSWTYETDIPHETFNIYEDGELFCVGIVFSINDL